MHTDTRADLERLLAHDGVASTLQPGEREQALDWLDESDTTQREPVLMKIMAGIGAWFASWFVLSALVIGLIDDSGIGALIIGGLLLFGSVLVIRRRASSVFIDQVGLAISLAGNGLLLFGIGQLAESDLFGPLLIGQAVIAAATWYFIDHPAFRFVAVGLVFLFATLLAFDAESAMLLYAVVAVAIAGMSLLAVPQLPQAILPLVHAASVSLAGVLLHLEFTARSGWFQGMEVSETPVLVMLGLGLLALVAWLYRQRELTPMAAGVGAGLVILLAVVGTPGVLFAAGMLALAYACGERLLGVLAALFLPLFLFHYYYAMDITLAKKSFLLLSSGAALLLVHQLVRRLGRSS